MPPKPCDVGDRSADRDTSPSTTRNRSRMSYVPEHVHFVGSIALDGPREVFAAAGRILGRRLKRIPDGEPGARIGWVQFQWPLFRNHGAFVEDHSVDPRTKAVGISWLRI